MKKTKGGNTVIGIDLGTSTTEAAVYRDGSPVMIINLSGDVITPSAVGQDDNGNWVVGERARAQLLLFPQNTAIEIKRKTGTGERISIGGSTWSPVELSARILEYVRNYASSYLKEDVMRAVISVPAYFNEIQRQETIAAGKMAGFKVERILNEPTAAALSYGLEHAEEESHILVFDLGGGTFDVTLLEMFDGVLEVKASSGDNRLGGKDFDEALCEWMLNEFRADTGINLRKDPYAMVRIKDEAERCKKELSYSDKYHVMLPALGKKGDTPFHLDRIISLDKFEELTRELMERTHGPIDLVLGDSGISAGDIDKVILVGGATRMPMVAREIEEYLGIKPEPAVNPDYAVAEGAAIQAAIISGDIRPEDGLIMTDVNPFSLGVRCFDGFSTDSMSVIIPRNATIPVTKKEKYTTSYDYQTEALIEVYQGESSVASSNHFLGKFTLGGIPAKKIDRYGGQSITVSFSYDLKVMLQVEAVVDSTGRKASIDIDMLGADTASDRETEKPGSSGDTGRKRTELAGKYKSLIRKAERELKKLYISGEPGEYDELDDALSDLMEAISEGDEASADYTASILNRILSRRG
ncbi:MAG: Hsp70 family protein [Lachnospiraceae bacterium]|nr:Hsp70 family protein [Lachnospiraceae bacterium]